MATEINKTDEAISVEVSKGPTEKTELPVADVTGSFTGTRDDLETIRKRRGLKLCMAVGACFLLACIIGVAVVLKILDPWRQESPEDAPSMDTELWELGCCRFAPNFSSADWRDPETQKSYIANVLAAERGFFAAPNISFDAETGMTYDGIGLSPSTGLPKPGTERIVSAPSKESLHLSLLALSLEPEESNEWLKKLSPRLFATEEALDVLEKKVVTLEEFDKRYPAFGGFLPWFCSRGARNDADRTCRSLEDAAGPLEPVRPSWGDRLPALDNGQLAWAAVAVVQVLEERAAGESDGRFAELAQRWRRRVERMRESAVNLFYNGDDYGELNGTVRAIAILRNASVDAATGPENAFTDNDFVLTDAFEGEMMVLFMDLLGNWSRFPDDGAAEKASVWRRKEEHVHPVTAMLPGRNVTVQQGFWFSSHEQWKILQLPYLDIALVKQLFANEEIARLTYSLQHGIPGLFASVNPPPSVSCPGGYCSAAGVEEWATQPVTADNAVTPYGAFPAIMSDPAAGLAWYNYMLTKPGMQSIAGSLESFAVKDSSVAPLLTWDAKATSVLAMLGGTGSVIRRYLEEQKLYAKFNLRVGGMYASVFGKRMGNQSTDDSQLPLPPQDVDAASNDSRDDHSCRCQALQQPRRLGRAPLLRR